MNTDTLTNWAAAVAMAAVMCIPDSPAPKSAPTPKPEQEEQVGVSVESVLALCREVYGPTAHIFTRPENGALACGPRATGAKP